MKVRAIIGVVGLFIVFVVGIITAEPGKKMGVLLLFLGIVTIVGGIVFLDYRDKGNKSKKLKEKADKLGWSFEKSLSDDLSEKYRLMYDIISDDGIYPRVSNVISGYFKGEKVTFFDYRHMMITQGTFTGNTSFVVIHNPTNNIPEFAVNYSKSKLSKVMSDGSKYINLKEYPIFSKHYSLRGNDEHKIQNLFTPEVVQFFESKVPEISWFVEVKESDIICRRSGPEIQSEEMNDFFTTAIKIRDILVESASSHLVSS